MDDLRKDDVSAPSTWDEWHLVLVAISTCFAVRYADMSLSPCSFKDIYSIT